MMKNINKPLEILLPVFPRNLKELYFKGHVDISEERVSIYVTTYKNNSEEVKEITYSKENIYGYWGQVIPRKKFNKFNNYFVLSSDRDIIKYLFIDGIKIDTSNCIIMYYDYDVIQSSQAIPDDFTNFSKLQSLINQDTDKSKIEISHIKIMNTQWLTSSMFLQHIYNYWILIIWLVTHFKKRKRMSIHQGNLVFAIITDVIIGYCVLQMLPEDKNMISSSLKGILEKLINSLYSLLTWLMGAPVGLKLNNAFNKMLGKYFSYHVQLWWLFLDVSGDKLDIILHIYNYIGYFGLTFQIAVISDMMCIATFHSYCIYVYAARLFNIQISGLIALLRLFVGRKYNPLRGGIDSCEYTNQELFVGTVAFTILLLLLPTTALYYIVFTMFRVLSLMVQYILAKLIYMIQTLPLYVVSLWAMGSPKVAGKVLLEVKSKEDSSLVLKVNFLSKSLNELVNYFKPPVVAPRHAEWTNLISNVLVGKQLN